MIRTSRFSALALTCAAVALLAFAGLARADDTYARVPVARLTFAGAATLPAAARQAWSHLDEGKRPRVVIDDAGVEAYLLGDTTDAQPWMGRTVPIAQMHVVTRSRNPARISGTLYFPSADHTAVQSLKFTFDPAGFASDRAHFLGAKIAHYAALRQADAPGSAWFRHQEREARRELGGPATQEADARQRWTRRGSTRGEFDDTFGLYTGGRAVSENLQLDRALPPSTQPETADVKLESIQGITVEEMDWAALIAQNEKPQLDPLAAMIPADQHAVFFPSFGAMVALLDEAQNEGSLLSSMAPGARSEDALSRQRYEKQLCLPLGKLASSLENLVGNVAITGSDLYLRVGSDVAVLFQPDNPLVLSRLRSELLTRHGVREAQGVVEDIDGVEYHGVRSPDLSVCSYLSTVGGMIVVTNSRAQLKRIIDAQSGKVPALSAAPEYTFFRQRYPRSDAKETALVVMSDAAIRRWCGPKWRIADSRRTRAAAALADLQASRASDVLAGNVDDTVLKSEFFVPEMEDVRLTRGGGVRSSVYGSLAFMTPIAELDFSTVTRNEADAYGRWRDTYQRNWSWAFDPIALRVHLDGSKISTDLTVMPLIARSEYTQLVELSTGAALTPTSGDPHPEAIGQIALAINPQSNTLKSWGNFMRTMSGNLRIEPLAWVGNSLSLYADEDEFWKCMTEAKDPEKYLSASWSQLPVGLFVESSSPIKLAAFLTALRAYADQSAPGMLRWETLQHGERQYVKVSSARPGRADGDAAEFSIHYVTMPDALVLSFNEDVVKRAMDRRNSGPTSQPATRPATRPWLGENLGFQLDPRMANVIAKAGEESSRRDAQARAWSNIAILNEWRRLYPDRSPVEVHQQLWGVRLIDPARTSYVWNEQWQTMESQTYGHAGEPKAGPSASDALRGLRANIGLTFEHKGLRGRAEIERPTVP